MATVAVKVVPDPDGVCVATWETLTQADVGAAANLSKYPDKTVTATGTFGGTTVTMQGSNDGTNWFTLHDNLGASIAFTAAGMALIAENPLQVRPDPAGGAGADVDVIIVGAPRRS